MRKTLALIFTILFVFPLIFAAQVSISTITFALDRDFYIQALSSDTVYQALLSEGAVDQLINSQLNLPPSFDTQEIQNIIQSAITKEYFQEQIETFINHLFDYLQRDVDTFEPTIHIAPIKESLQGDKQDELAAAIVAALPECEPGQAPGLGGESQTACKPPGVPDEVFAEQVKAILPLMIASVPDEIPVAENWESFQDRSSWPSFLSGMALPAAALLIVIFVTILATAFWYLSALIADESWRERLQWLGWALIIPSIFVFLISLAFSSDIPNYWVRLALEGVNFDSSLFGPMSSEVYNTLIRSALPRIASSFMIVSGVSSALGLSLIFWAPAASQKKPKET